MKSKIRLISFDLAIIMAGCLVASGPIAFRLLIGDLRHTGYWEVGGNWGVNWYEPIWWNFWGKPYGERMGPDGQKFIIPFKNDPRAKAR